MHADYSKLWRLCQKKQISKTELGELTGLSSRTIAKLSANRDVNMDTLIKICFVLRCDISDIVSIVDDERISSVYDAFLKTAVRVGETDFVTEYECEFEGKEYHITLTKAKADKFSVIKCENNTVLWNQRPKKPWLSGETVWGRFSVIYQVPPLKDGKIHIFAVNGAPDSIEGLDDGIFRSARHQGNTTHLHVMSLAAFKVFVIQDNNS